MCWVSTCSKEGC